MLKLPMANLLLFFSLASLRIQTAIDLHYPAREWLSRGIWLGFVLDLACVALINTVASLLRPTKIRKIIWILSALLIWGGVYSNSMYLKFFNSPLEFWIATDYIGDVMEFSDSVGSLSLAILAVLSIISVLISIFVLALDQTELSTYTLKKWMAVFILSIAFTQYFESIKDPIAKQVYKFWIENYLHDQKLKKTLAPEKTLAEYRDLYRPSVGSPTIHYPWVFVKDETAKRADLFGFNSKKPVHVILVFVESFRKFDFGTPRLRELIFPNLGALVEKRGVSFEQTYSSATTAGMTARGQFSTLCSIPSTMDGPSEFLAHYKVSVRCLAELFREAKYSTLWFNALNKSFHHTYEFEARHGTQFFYDRVYFQQPRIPDREFLSESLKVILKHADEGRPIFANLLTFSSHHPFVPRPDTPVPENLKAELKDFPEYEGYLSKFKYTEAALAQFIEDVFASSIGDQTLIVMLGDHSVNVRPPTIHTPLQAQELRFRIPLLFFSKHLKKPAKILDPVHQIDVAPTLARIAGLRGDVTWLGRDLFRTLTPGDSRGSPWFSKLDSGVPFRIKNKVCVATEYKSSPDCWLFDPLKDPLYDPPLKAVETDPKEVEKFQALVPSIRHFIKANVPST